MIQVTRDESVPERIDTLRFYVGVGDSGNAGATQYVDDPTEDVSFAEGRDLLSDPYKLLLRQSDASADMSLMVVVLGLQAGEIRGLGQLTQPVSFVQDKVLLWEVALTGNVGGRIVTTPTGCITILNDQSKVEIASPEDLDCDGDPASTDCNDTNPTVGPSRTEICDNQIDDNCNDMTDEETDNDGDLVTNCAGDCNDNDPEISPEKAEVCDGKDNNCNGICDDGEVDPDGDTYTSCGTHILEDGTCTDMSSANIDCEPDIKAINPGADEICDGVDNNCDGRCDDNQDPDGDTFTACGSIVDECLGIAEADQDCGPSNPNQHPGATEACDGVDNDCDGVFYPETAPCYGVDANSGSCAVGVRSCGDHNGSGWLGDCAPSSATGDRVPMELCTNYANCDAMDDPDPFECANNLAVTMQHDCTVFHNSEGTLCPNAEALLPNIASGQNTTCTATLAPGAAVEHYDIGLRLLSNPGTSGDTTVTGCDAVLKINGMNSGSGPGFDSRLIQQTAVDTVTSSVTRKVDFSPMSVATCPTFGLMCTGLAAPTLP